MGREREREEEKEALTHVRTYGGETGERGNGKGKKRRNKKRQEMRGQEKP